MHNEVEFVALAHKFLLKKRFEGEDRQLYKNMITNVQTSLQATRKKRFTPLDLKHYQALNAATSNTTPITQNFETDQSESSTHKTILTQGLIDNSTALKLTSNE